MPYASLPEGKAGRLLACNVLAVTAVIFFLGLLEPALHWYQARQDELRAKQQEVSHILQLRNRMPRLRGEVAALQAFSGSQVVFPAGDSDAVAAATLQSTIESLARQSNASLSSTAVLPAQPAGGLRQIAINVNLTAPWKVLIDLLSAIDLAQPRMTVSDLAITSSQDEDITQAQPLQIGFTVAAFRPAATP